MTVPENRPISGGQTPREAAFDDMVAVFVAIGPEERGKLDRALQLVLAALHEARDGAFE